MKAAAAALALACAATAAAQTTVDTATVFAAGSLRAALTDVARAFEQQGAAPTQRLQLSFGASGLLKDRIAAGEPAQLFASANMHHPQALQTQGLATRVQPFARNTLCALAVPGFALQGRSLAQRVLDADVRVGISTPVADPSGDYAFELFDRIEASAAGPAGSAAALKAKALQLTGGPQSPPPPAGRNVYGALMASGQADVFITYCTNATQARQEQPQLQLLQWPAAINVSATYGVATLNQAGETARLFVGFLLGPHGQDILRQHGFSAP
jgi:molybdate transport system substrate-binding protein